MPSLHKENIKKNSDVIIERPRKWMSMKSVKTVQGNSKIPK